MKRMNRPSVTEVDRGVYEMEIEISSIHFCDTWSVHPFHSDRNSSKTKFRIEIWTFSFQICFQNQLRKYAYLRNFQFDHFPK